MAMLETLEIFPTANDDEVGISSAVGPAGCEQGQCAAKDDGDKSYLCSDPNQLQTSVFEGLPPLMGRRVSKVTVYVRYKTKVYLQR
jgi:hypothetical protein